MTTTTRRLAAILAADVAGYSRLMGADEVGTLEALKSHRREVVDPAIAGHHGRIVKTTGDGILVEFASAVDAVTCAMSVQEQMAQRNTEPHIQFRIGINIGDIISEVDDIFGDGVNVAARVENECEPGGVYLSGSAHEQVRGKTKFEFDDLGERSLKNIERPVRLYAARGAKRASTIAPQAPEEAPLPLPDKPSIAVLPFQNMSGDPEQEYFADGMVEDITTALSRFKSLFVIARNSSFTYKGRAIDIKTIGRELGVRYVLEGSVRKVGDRIRISGQLVEAATGGHLWADKFDGSSHEIFELQDRVTSQVVGVIAPKIERVEIEHAKRRSTENLVAYDYYLRGLASYDEWTRAGNEEAVRLLSKAVKIDPDFAGAISWVGAAYTQRLIQGWTLDVTKDTDEALRHARMAIEITREDGLVLGQSAATLLFFAAELDAAISLTERALRLNPNAALAWCISGWVQFICGFPNVAIDHNLRALQLNPIDVLNFLNFVSLARSHLVLGRLHEARKWAEKAMTDNPAFLATLRTMAAIEATAGDLEKARHFVDRILENHPGHTSGGSTTARMMRNEEHRRIYVEALRLAGLPE
jgi:adenylate cyclase